MSRRKEKNGGKIPLESLLSLLSLQDPAGSFPCVFFVVLVQVCMYCSTKYC
jgi:hypothetical protein